MKLTSKTLFPVGLTLFVSSITIILAFEYYLNQQLLNDFIASKNNEVSHNSGNFLSEDDFADPTSETAKKNFSDFINAIKSSEIIDVSIWNSSGQNLASFERQGGEKEQNKDSDIVREMLNHEHKVKLVKADEETFRGDSLQSNISLFHSGRIYESFVPIHLAGKDVGVVEVLVSDLYISMLAKRIAFSIIALLFVSYLVVFAIIALQLEHYIINPVQQVVGAAIALRNGVWNFPIATKRNKNDEVGDLSSSFDYMRTALKQAFEELNAKNLAIQETERKTLLVNQALEFEKDRREGILSYLHAISEGIIATDINEKITFINSTGLKMTGCKNNCQLVVGKKYGEFFNFSNEKKGKLIPINPIAEVLKTNKIFVLPRRSSLSNGTEQIAISGSFTPIYKNEKLLGTIGIFQDITELDKLEREKDNFLSIAAHQLRTPLSGIKWTIETMLDDEDAKLSVETKTAMQEIFDNVQRLNLLVNDLLDVSKINIGKSKEEPVIIEIYPKLNEIANSLKGLATERKIFFSFENKPGKSLNVKFGPQKFFQVFANLFSNAIKYTSSHGAVKISTVPKNDNVVISISDTGIGIPEKDKDKIFQKFYRGSNAILKETEGSGLGLNLVKSYIEEAGGKIWFESYEKKGTIFHIELPLALEETKPN